MERYRYLIVGGGMTADAAVSGIREVEPAANIGLISAEADPPYDRPPLSKGLWKGDALGGIWRQTSKDLAGLRLGRTIRKIDSAAKVVVDDQGVEYGYDKLLLATGGTPRRLPFGEDLIIYFRTLADYRQLRELAGPGKRVAVVGGGFIGSEIAASLAINGVAVTMVLMEEAIGGLVYPADLAQFLNDYYRGRGVEVVTSETVSGVERRNGAVVITTRSGREIIADVVVAGLGITPNVELAEQAGLKIENGIAVDEVLRTSNSDIYSAGDVANFHDPILGKRRRVEHEDAANTMGRLAGRAMAGAPEPYRDTPFFYSDLFDLGYEAVGELSARLDIVSDWREPFHEGVIYYLQESRVRGVLLWNVWDSVESARKLLAEPGPHRPDELVGRIGAGK